METISNIYKKGLENFDVKQLRMIVVIGFLVTGYISYITNASISIGYDEKLVAIGQTLVMQMLAFQFASTFFKMGKGQKGKAIYFIVASILYIYSIAATAAYFTNQVNETINEATTGTLFTTGLTGLIEMINKFSDVRLETLYLIFYWGIAITYESAITLAYVQYIEKRDKLKTSEPINQAKVQPSSSPGTSKKTSSKFSQEEINKFIKLKSSNPDLGYKKISKMMGISENRAYELLVFLEKSSRGKK